MQIGGQAADGPFIDRVLMFSDIEQSSARWDTEPDVMGELMRHHDALVSNVVEDCGGAIGARTGDGAIALFMGATQPRKLRSNFNDASQGAPLMSVS